MTSHAIEPRPLQNAYVALEPLSQEHVPGLREAAADGRLWELWYTSVPDADATADYVSAALAAQALGQQLPFAVRDRGTGAIVGSTRYCRIDASLPRLEIGYTWYAARCQRTHINSACKLLLLQHAFEVLGCVAVELRTDRYNLRSQRAIENLGAVREGVQRAGQRRPDGSIRDTVIYSIIAAEWPDVRRLLEQRLQRLAGG